MAVNFILKDTINVIAEKLGTKAQLDNKFGLEYLLPNVTEEKLIEAGFKYIGTDRENRPMYRYENIEAIFMENLLHMYELN